MADLQRHKVQFSNGSISKINLPTIYSNFLFTGGVIGVGSFLEEHIDNVENKKFTRSSCLDHWGNSYASLGRGSRF